MATAFDRFGAQLGTDLAQALAIEGQVDAPVGQHALGQIKAQLPFCQGCRFFQRQVVHIVAAFDTDFDGIAEAGGGDQGGLRAFALDQGVGDEGGAVDDVADGGGRVLG